MKTPAITLKEKAFIAYLNEHAPQLGEVRKMTGWNDLWISLYTYQFNYQSAEPTTNDAIEDYFDAVLDEAVPDMTDKSIDILFDRYVKGKCVLLDH